MCLHVCPQPPHSLLTFISLNITLFSLTTSPFKYFDVLYPPRTLCSSVSSFTMWPLPLLFLLHILDFLNHPADHHLVWPDTTLKSPIHFQTAPSASAYHVFNLYSRPPPPHTHTLTQSNVFRIQNQLLSSPYHHTNTSLSPRFPSHMSTEIWSSHQSQPPGDTLFHFIQLTAEVPRHCTHLCRRPRKKHHLHNRITTLPRL